MRRRDFLTLAAGGMLAAVPPGRFARGGMAVSGRPIGLQLFTVMSLLEQDFEGTIRTVAELGYKEVETMGAFQRDPAYVRGLFDKYGLVSPSQHLMPGDLYRDFSAFVQNTLSRDEVVKKFLAAFDYDRVPKFMEEAVGRAKILGQKYIVWQMNWQPDFTLKEVDKLARAFNLAGDICSREGLTFVIHNHDAEFKPIGAAIPYDLLVEGTDPAKVKLEIDFYWAITGGADPVGYFTRFPGRYKLCHLKDRGAEGEIVTVGQGTENVPRLLDAAEKAGITHYYVEYDKPTEPLKSITASYAYLKTVF
jgi:sugar phosphate isomerase/epimerase